ncbi:hypothetical protein [Sodalis-like endosymbiont of Proechinophthirus fluctus]|uniref:hypothetical protein n=1 Tax=Sodalis-like endosymbiont of Proechinophthirus fluctus TaxID=1462730 RepID=UPI00164FA399|nr:hypothetical protein [Sodalis-like endosymbiont of Proechinophthirus fluctus]
MMVKVDRWQLWVVAIGMMLLPVVAQLLLTLRDYPLYPYLAYRQLSQDLSQVSPD